MLYFIDGGGRCIVVRGAADKVCEVRKMIGFGCKWEKVGFFDLNGKKTT